MQLQLVATAMAVMIIMVHLLVMPSRTSVQQVGVCLQEAPLANTKPFTLPILAMPRTSITLSVPLSQATSTVARPTIRARAVSSGRLLTAIVTPCTVWSSIRRLSTRRVAAVATSAFQSGVCSNNSLEPISSKLVA